MALKYKGISFETVDVDYFNRDPIREVSGQDGTPIIMDKGIVLNDSEAIIQYLDANYPETPRLMPVDLKGRYACDNWKTLLDKKVVKPWFKIWRYVLRRVDSFDKDARKEYAEALHWLDSEIGDRASFNDHPEMAICDLRVALWSVYGLPGDGLLNRVGLLKSSQKAFNLDKSDYPNLTRFLNSWHPYTE